MIEGYEADGEGGLRTFTATKKNPLARIKAAVAGNGCPIGKCEADDVTASILSLLHRAKRTDAPKDLIW